MAASTFYLLTGHYVSIPQPGAVTEVPPPTTGQIWPRGQGA